jgi:hypothetical protein
MLELVRLKERIIRHGPWFRIKNDEGTLFAMYTGVNAENSEVIGKDTYVHFSCAPPRNLIGENPWIRL